MSARVETPKKKKEKSPASPFQSEQSVGDRHPSKKTRTESSASSIGNGLRSGRSSSARSSNLDVSRSSSGGEGGNRVMYRKESSWPKNLMCTICMEPMSPFRSFGANGCSHLYCVDCMKRYLVSKINERASLIRCPDPKCKSGTFEPENCRGILTPRVFEKWCGVLCESLVLGSTRFYCPFKDCSAPLMNEGDNGAIKESECPHCWRLFCAQCKVPWHADISCDDFQKMDRNERSSDDIKLFKLAKDKKWQRCPKCKFMVERTEGCKFMKCRCGFVFCYGCGTEMTRDHFCTTCRG